MSGWAQLVDDVGNRSDLCEEDIVIGRARGKLQASRVFHCSCCFLSPRKTCSADEITNVLSNVLSRMQHLSHFQ